MLSIKFRSRIFVGLLLSLSSFAIHIAAQTGSVDPTFNAVPTNALPTDINFQQVIQPDGKILVYGAPSVFIGGELRSGMFRLNPDGSLDPSFTYNSEAAGIGINSVLVAPDGKILVGGTGTPNHGKMIRLNSDGSLDNSFSVFIQASGPPEFTGNVLRLNAIQPDGKIIATHTSWGNIGGTWYSHSMRRYNLDASIDSSFVSPPLEGGHLMYTWPLIELLPDGRFYLALTSRSHLGGFLNITRRLANGVVDPTYTAYQAPIQASGFLSIEDISVASDGGLLGAGVFQQTAIGFPPVQQLRRFLPDGSLAPGFTSPLVMSASAVHQLPDGKILYSASGGTISRPLIRLNADGSVDSTYVLDPVVTGIINVWRVDALNRPIFLAQTAAGRRLVRLQADGSLDPTFNPSMGSPGVVNIVAVQQDGKLLVAGTYAFMNGVARNKISRVNPDGTLDLTFDPGTGLSNFARQLAIQPDGKIIAVGPFASYNGVTTGPVVRLNADGSIDNSFSVTVTGSSSVESVAVQPDGKILIGGGFTAINGTGRTRIARLESNGALDATFNPVLGGTGIVRGIVVESSGKIVIGGLFTGVNGDARNNLARLESNGTTDLTFNSTINQVSSLYRQSDGKYLATIDNGAGLTRRNADGSTDTAFTPPTIGYSGTPLFLSALQLPDSSILIGGRFETVNGSSRRNLARLQSNGTLISAFLPNGANGDVGTLQLQTSDRIIVGGSFTSVDNVSRVGVARLTVPAIQVRTRFDFDGDGRADVAVYRPSSGVWYQLFSSGIPYGSPTFGLAGDIPVPADYDGDGKTDLAIFRPSTGMWWYNASATGQLRAATLGQAGDIPLPSDYTGDGQDDFVTYRPSNGSWYRTSYSTGSTQTVFGIPGDIPVIGDFDGDGKSDPAIFRPSNGDWWYMSSAQSNGHRTLHWGATGDIPAPADFDGDGKTDFAVFRPSNGAWYIFKSSDSSYIIRGFGLDGDRPAPADYDGDGRADMAVFRPSTGVWYILRSTAGITGAQWGLASDVAVPNAFLPQ